MISIFYDLETSSKNPIGQILNYCFICVDSDFIPVAELVGDIRLSRLQLPEPQAILANRINILELQASVTQTEPKAMHAIRIFIEEQFKSFPNQEIALIGYNSSRFDLPYLRTSMIRNGINPYFKNLSYRDLLQSVRKLSTSDQNFPRIPAVNADEEQLSLKLEALTQHFGLLKGKQAHSSRDDVILTINFADFLKKEFNHDVRTYQAYEPEQIKNKGSVILSLKPEYDLTSKDRLSQQTALMLIDQDHRSSLWLNLDKEDYEEPLKHVNYFNKKTSALILSKEQPSAEIMAKAERLKSKCENINLANFFKPSTCDIEQDIYRLDFDGIDYLTREIWGQVKASNTIHFKEPSKDARVLLTRYKINNQQLILANSEINTTLQRQLQQYCQYRYSGKLQLWKNISEEQTENLDAYHASFKTIYADLENLLLTADIVDRKLLTALKEYYHTSDLWRYANLESLLE